MIYLFKNDVLILKDNVNIVKKCMVFIRWFNKVHICIVMVDRIPAVAVDGARCA